MRECATLLSLARSMIRRQEGSVTVLAVFMFVAMLLVAGLAVDMMRYESERARVQGTADRAVLAAAMMRDNPANPSTEAIVRSYFAAEGLEHLLDKEGAISISNVRGAREVIVRPQSSMRTTFMRLSGIDTLPMRAAAGASEALTQVEFEIAMVLDVSGSMAYNNRIENLREAAIEFVRDMLADNESGRVAITFVPYSNEVVMPAGALSYLTNLAPPASGDMTNAFCFDFLEWQTVTNSINAPTIRRNCAFGESVDGRAYKSLAEMPVRPFVTNLAEAEAYINSLAPSWGTAIDLGVRVGAMFFDPTIRPITAHLIDNAQVDSRFENHPRDWNAPARYRALILMTDGENCCFWDGDPARRKLNVEIQDADTISVCDAIKEQDISIYSVAFEAPQGGVDLMRACATAPSYYFNSSGQELVNAFRQIATHIQAQALRLTQ